MRVFVLGFDKEKRISLGYRRAEDNPWTKFISTFSISIPPASIAKFMPFGRSPSAAGVDGLIHISQIMTPHITPRTSSNQRDRRCAYH